MPTGWRPADVEARFPVRKIEDVYNFKKYAPAASKELIVWAWVQFTFTFVLIYTLFNNLMLIGFPNAIICGFFIVLGIYAYTELMDRNPYAWVWETLRNVIGLGILVYMGNWFGVESAGNWMSYFLGAYFVVATVVTAGFVVLDIRKAPVQEVETVMDYSIS